MTEKLERLIIVSVDTDVCVFNSVTKTLPAGTYYLRSPGSEANGLLQKLELLTGTTITLDDDSMTSTGRVTIFTDTTFTWAWSSTWIRDLLGFTGDLSGADTYTGTKHAESLWLPSTGRSGVTAPNTTSTSSPFGMEEIDYSFTQAPSGASRAVGFTRRTGVETLTYSPIYGYKTWIAFESIPNESLQTFWRSGIALGLPVRFYPDRSDDSVYCTYVVTDGGKFKPTSLRDSWVGADALFTISYNVVAKL
jgi:hypothetical protein